MRRAGNPPHSRPVYYGFIIVLFWLGCFPPTDPKTRANSMPERPPQQAAAVDGPCSEDSGSDIRTLEPKTPILRMLAGGQSHYYRFSLPAGVFEHAVVDQVDIDVKVSVVSCANDRKPKLIAEVDRQSGSLGPEGISFITENSETRAYILRVEALQPNDPVGPYRIALDTPRNPRASDLVRIEAERAVTEGGKLYIKGSNENLTGDARRESLEESVRKFDHGSQLWRSLNEPYEEAIAAYGIGYCYSDLGSLGMVKFPLPSYRPRWSYQSRDEHQKAIDAFQKALAFMKNSGNKYGQAITKAGMAWPQLYLGRDQDSLQNFSEAFQLFRSIKKVKGEGRALYGQAWAYAFINNNQKALDFFLRALPLRRAAGETTGAAITQASICRIYSRLGKNEKAIGYCQQALDTFKGRKHGTASTQAVMGFAYTALRQYDKALDSFQKALALREELKDPTGEAHARYGIARVRRDQGRLSEALTEMEKVLKKIGPLRKEGTSDELRTYFFANVQEYYEFYIDLLMSMGRDTSALEVSESARARELLATLAEAEDYSQTDPSWAKPLSAPEIQHLLDADTLLLEFALGEDRSFVWLVSSEEIHGYNLPKGSDLEAKALELHRLMMARPPWPTRTKAERAAVVQSEAKTSDLASDLSQLLLGQVAAQLGNKRLVIVAQGALQFVPFAALPKPSTETQSNKNRTLLIADHEIVNLPSASILFALRQRVVNHLPAPKTIAILADPVFTADDLRVQPEPPGSRSTPRSSRTTERAATPGPEDAFGERSESNSDTDLSRLDASRWEAEQIASLVRPGEGLLALDFTASRSKALNGELKLNQYRIVHFATHALVDDVNPAQSRIVLSSVDEYGRPQNGALTLQDIDKLHLPAELIVLSACRTGLGKRVKGEGLMGLTSSFMHAGAARVIVSLWPVKDDATAEFMVRFYRRLLNYKSEMPGSMAAGRALKEAQEDMKNDYRWKSDYYWAPFVLQGDWK